eukprot:5512884-Amphidinium_carterae.1
MRPWVLGFSYPGHSFPPGPAQPGRKDDRPASPRSVVATGSRYLLYVQAADGRGTWERTHPNTPAKPGDPHTPKFDNSSIVQADVHDYLANGTVAHTAPHVVSAKPPIMSMTEVEVCPASLFPLK